MSLKFKDYVDKARAEKGTLEITFIRISDNKPRTVVYNSEVEAGYRIDYDKALSPSFLKKIEKNHDRIYAKTLKFVGAYFTFPEKITEHSTEHNDQSYHIDRHGVGWQWRSLYVQQIKEIKYNGQVVISIPDNQMFDFKFIGDDEEVYTKMTAEEVQKAEKESAEREYDRVRREAEWELVKKDAKQLAPTLTEKDCGVNLGMMNGWSYRHTPDVVKRKAILMKHNQLMHSNPERHWLYDNESYHAQMHGFHDLRCPCGFGYGWDSSD